MRKISLLFALIGIIMGLFGCKSASSYQSISVQEAKRIMDTQTDYIILDVRTLDEYNSGHIKNAILIPNDEITNTAENILTDKNQLILVYCRSGRRSKDAASKLAKLGYTNIKEFGGIINWSYEIVY